MADIYKGILDKKGKPIRLMEIMVLYKLLHRQFGKASCERVADQLTTMGYKSKLGGDVNRHQIFRALMRTEVGPDLLATTAERVGK